MRSQPRGAGGDPVVPTRASLMLREQVQKTVASDSGRVASQQCTTRARQWCQVRTPTATERMRPSPGLLRFVFPSPSQTRAKHVPLSSAVADGWAPLSFPKRGPAQAAWSSRCGVERCCPELARCAPGLRPAPRPSSDLCAPDVWPCHSALTCAGDAARPGRRLWAGLASGRVGSCFVHHLRHRGESGGDAAGAASVASWRGSVLCHLLPAGLPAEALRGAGQGGVRHEEQLHHRRHHRAPSAVPHPQPPH